MRASENFKRSTLSVDTIKRIINHASKNNVGALSFTGGEPMLFFDELVELLSYAGDKNIACTRTGTNGFFFKNSDAPDYLDRISVIAKRLARTPVRNFWISIDSPDPKMHERMRGFEGVIEGIRKALPIFHEEGIYPSANLGINRLMAGSFEQWREEHPNSGREQYLNRLVHFYGNAFHSFFKFVISLGFTMVNVCYPMSINPSGESKHLNAVYSATSTDRIVNFTADEKAAIYRTLLSVIPVYRCKIRIFTPLCALYELSRQYEAGKDRPYSCRGGIDFFFINAKDGNAYPCGFRGNESFGKYWELGQHETNSHAPCTRCDWECFRDPSELFGPFIRYFSNPGKLASKLMRDPKFFRLWMDDLAYYHECNLFDGRKPLKRH